MDMRQITPTYFVSPQIEPGEMADIAAAGVTRIIDNRPDAEVPPPLQADAVEAAAQAAGIEFVRLPLTHQTMTPDNVAAHRDAIDGASGAVLAYCASGTRSTVVWALGQAQAMETDEILGKARAAGYQLDGLRPTLEAMRNEA